MADCHLPKVAEEFHESTNERFRFLRREAGQDQRTASAAAIHGFPLRAAWESPPHYRARSSRAIRHSDSEQWASIGGTSQRRMAESSDWIQRPAIRHGT